MNKFEQPGAEKSPMEAKKEEIILKVEEKYLEKLGAAANARIGMSERQAANELSKEARNRNKIHPAIEGLYNEYMDESGGIPPTEEEFENYVESKMG